MLSTKVSLIDPVLIKTWTKGRDAWKCEATETFNSFLMDKMQTVKDIPGIGERQLGRYMNTFERMQSIKDPVFESDDITDKQRLFCIFYRKKMEIQGGNSVRASIRQWLRLRQDTVGIVSNPDGYTITIPLTIS